MIERTTDPQFLNQVLNDPAVRPWVADVADGALDMTPAVSNPENVCLVGEHGGFFLYKYDVGVFEVHSAVRPSGRGAWAKAAAKSVVDYMFTATDCVEILTRIPQGHLGAKALAEATGFRHQFTTPPDCLFRGERVPAHIYSLTLQEWWLRAEGMEERGANFHKWLNEQVGNGHGEPHPTDLAHNRIVGVAIAMAMAGRVRKGVVFYNSRCLPARHATISLIGESKIRFDAGLLTFSRDSIRYERLN